MCIHFERMTLRPRQNGCPFADYILNEFLYDNFCFCGNIFPGFNCGGSDGTLTGFVKLRVAQAPGMPGTWAQVEWWLEHRHGWLVKRQWARSWLGRVTRDEYQVLGSTSIPARLDTLVYWESFSWLTSVGTTRNTVNRLGWSRIGLAVLILNAAGAGLIGRPAVISGRYNKCHSLQLQSHYAHFPPLQHTRIHARHSYAELVVGNDHGFRGIVCWPWQEESCVIG